MRVKTNKIALLILCISLFLSLFPEKTFCTDIIPRSKYLHYAKASADWTWEHYDELIERWKNQFDPSNVFGYRPPGGLLEMAVIYAHLFKEEGKHDYKERAKKVLLSYRGFRSLYPEWAVQQRPDYDDLPPVLPDFFTVMRYIRAFDILNRLEAFSKNEIKHIETDIVESMDYLLRSQEWGPMNRAALRAETLAWAVRALPGHEKTEVWEMQRKALGDDNWGNWQIEDATIYHGVWLYALCGYAHALENMDDLFKTPEMYYYSQYFLHLMSPSGMIPDFGDANWLSNWNRFLVFFEAAAAQYKDPHIKWAASTIASKFIDFDNPTSTGLGYILLDCYLWGSDVVSAKKPESLSKEVMEDVQGKKIVFRNGWNERSTYMLLNYRDEGDGGLNFRDYLRDTIPVEEEKMTHGHADENSIIILMSNGSMLLHDGGYRDYMPSGPFGAYRQDYFHNRLCVRPEKIWMGQEQGQFRYSIRDEVPGQSILEFLHNAGSYREVRTQRVDFLALQDFDYSRTRLTDEKMGYQWDRVITYIKSQDIFVIFDIFKSLREEYYTLSNLWHTRKIIEQGDHWYDTVYDRIQNQEFPTETHLLIVFPMIHYRLEGVEPEKRHYQDEFLIHQTTAQHFELGETVGFTTVLIPHSSKESPQKRLDGINLYPIEPEEAGLGIKITSENSCFTVGVKMDLRMDMSRDWRRPRYTYEAGKMKYGEFETNGDFFFSAQKETVLDYTIVNLTKAYFKEKTLIDPKPSLFGLAFDGSPYKAGVGKLRYWTGRIELKKD